MIWDIVQLENYGIRLIRLVYICDNRIRYEKMNVILLLDKSEI